MARPRAYRITCWSLFPLSKKRAWLSNFNQWQRHSQCTFAVSWAPIHRAAEIVQGVPTNKRWLLCSHCQYFLCSPACSPALALFPVGKLFNQLLKAQFWITRSLESNLSSARTSLIPVKQVILTESLPTWFHVKTLAPNRLNVRQSPIFLKKPPAFYLGLKWNSVVENWTEETSYLKGLQHYVVTPQRSNNAKTAEEVLWKKGWGPGPSSRMLENHKNSWVLWMTSGARWEEIPSIKLKWYRIG